MSDISKTIIYCAEIVNKFHRNELTSKNCGFDEDTYVQIIGVINDVKEHHPDYSIGKLKAEQAIAVQELLDKNLRI